MCGSMVDIQSEKAEIRRGRKRKKKKKLQDENKMPASATQGDHNNIAVLQNNAKQTVESNTYHQCLHTVSRRIKNPYRTTMGQERLDSLSLLCIEADVLRSVAYENVIKDVALAKSQKMTF